MHNYDLIYASKLIYGEQEEDFKEIFWDPSKLPLKEGLTPLFLFLSSILKPFPMKKIFPIKKYSGHIIRFVNLFWAGQQLSLFLSMLMFHLMQSDAKHINKYSVMMKKHVLW